MRVPKFVGDLLPSGVSVAVTLAILLAVALEIFALFRLKRVKLGKSGRSLDHGLLVLAALLIGLLNGLVLRSLFTSSIVDVAWGINDALEWIDVLRALFLQSFEILIVPLILVSIFRSMLKAGSGAETGKSAVRVLAVLIITVAVAAAIGYAMVALFPIEVDYGSIIPTRKEPTTLIKTITDLVPSNFFSALSSNKALPIVFLSFVIGLSALTVRKEFPELGKKLELIAELGYNVVGTVVDFVIALMPVGILGIVTVNISVNDWGILATYGWFVVAFFTGIALIFLVHMLILLLFGVNLPNYFKHTAGTYLFAFTSMSSMATLPLTIQSQKDLGVSEATANLAGSLGTCVGQNACAGLYPAMIATLVALGTEGVNVWSVEFALSLVLMTAIGSIGAAGVGGGNIQASLITLSLLGLDSGLITIFLAIDFFVGLPRPPINAGDSIVAGLVAQRLEDRANRKNKKKGVPDVLQSGQPV